MGKSWSADNIIVTYKGIEKSMGPRQVEVLKILYEHRNMDVTYKEILQQTHLSRPSMREILGMLEGKLGKQHFTYTYHTVRLVCEDGDLNLGKQ